MKKILKDCFTGKDNETYTLPRVIIVPMFSILYCVAFIYCLIHGSSIMQLSIASLISALGFCVIAYFGRLYEDGTVKSTISAITEKVKL